jgi:hypothetical protein
MLGEESACTQAAREKKHEEREAEIGDGLNECCFAAVSTAELEAQARPLSRAPPIFCLRRQFAHQPSHT